MQWEWMWGWCDNAGQDDDWLKDWKDSGLSSWVPCKTMDTPESLELQEKAVPSI